jgi:fatty acid desaturase
LLRLALFPHHVNYHIEHHLFPAVPHYRLPQLHAELAARGVLRAAEVRRPVQTWRRVFAAADSTRAPEAA